MVLNHRFYEMHLSGMIFSFLVFFIHMQIVENNKKSTETCKESVCLKNEHDSSTFTALIETKQPIKFEDFDFSGNHDVESITFENQAVMKDENETISKFSNLDSLIENENITAINNTFEVTEAESKFNFGNLSITTPVVEVSEKNKSADKINLTTTSIPPLEFWNFKNTSNDICFCDLTFNECDINCCCDIECTPSHYKIFTECIDNEISVDKNYCFKNSVIFKNNTSLKLVQSSNGLFCIEKDNSQLSYQYKTIPIITNLESFNKSLPPIPYSYLPKNPKRLNFIFEEYKAGLPVWTVGNSSIKTFDIPTSSISFLCTSKTNIKYLVNQVTKCSYTLSKSNSNCEVLKTKNLLNYLRNVKIISNPGAINKSEKLDFSKICSSVKCIGININICQFSSDLPCNKFSEKVLSFQKLGCWTIVSKIVYSIKHNGTEGIQSFDTFVWLKNIPVESGDNYLQTTEVKYSWVGSPEKMFIKSGNPGYHIGKPILAGKKVYYVANGTVDKKEAILLSLDSNEWLTVLGSEKGICSSTKRIPVNFKENSQYMCSLQLTKDMFNKDKCGELQKEIFQLLIGNEVVNATTENYFNKFVATFGNSKVENTEQWVQVLIDLFPVISSQVGFKSSYNSLMCKNMITDLVIEIAYANIGAFNNPQAKILGVLFHFGDHKDLTFYCDIFGCANTKSVQNFRLSSTVQFFDLSESAVDTFAEPLGLEIKLSHDFFYPFFSKSSQLSLSTFIFCFTFLEISLIW